MTFNEFKELVIAECAAQGIAEYELYYQAGASTNVGQPLIRVSTITVGGR